MIQSGIPPYLKEMDSMPSDRARVPFHAAARTGGLLLTLFALSLPATARAQISHNVVLLGHVDSYEFHSDVWGYRAPDGTELAIVGTREGTSVVDATNPGTAHEIAFFPGPS